MGFALLFHLINNDGNRPTEAQARFCSHVYNPSGYDPYDARKIVFLAIKYVYHIFRVSRRFDKQLALPVDIAKVKA
jgi:hypothetical protein